MVFDRPSQELVKAHNDFIISRGEVLGCLDVVWMMCFQFFFHGRYTLCQPGLLLNRNEFPIGIFFGDRDILGSEGAELIIKSNAFYATGDS
mmetsp:Transcript_19767/g.24411  ORF Transcript_19767/g.24411 Transcript_19767/m.24411 type:complete len:91 (+) Transcript_19767:718-990(+)